MTPAPKAPPKAQALVPRLLPWEGPSLLEMAARLPGIEVPVFLDSASGPEELSRYSILAWNPFESFSFQGNAGTDPFDATRAFLSRFAISREGLEIPFAGGAMGWFGYDLGRFLEKLPRAAPSGLALPELFLGLYDAGLVEDRKAGKTFAWICEWAGDSGRSGKAYLRQRLTDMLRAGERVPRPDDFRSVSKLESDHDRESYANAVRRAKELIYAGDIYQVNLSQEFRAKASGDSFGLYRALRESNPAPYAAFLSTPEGDLLSSSPELFLRKRGSRIETRPIKGTRPRAGEEAKDAGARAELLASAKDRAELTMIVDLERNDLKRVCRPGSVQVPRLHGLESYETVFHLVASVEGEMRADCDFVDALRATFPGGSISGAPKIRAMEIITELEKRARSIYTGSIGWIGFDGDAELNIAIRTLIRSGDDLSFRVGGGIVADSDPEMEFEETLHKGRGLARALGVEW